MARPKQDNLIYFPVDVGILGNPKMELAINEIGSDALSVYIALLCGIYSNSYWASKADPRIKVLPAKLHMPIDSFDLAYDCLLKFGLIEEVEAVKEAEKEALGRFAGTPAVTSGGIQEQYFTSKKHRVISKELPFLKNNLGFFTNNGGLFAQEPLKEKESKEKESKEKESKEKETTFIEQVSSILDHLNSETGKHFKPTSKKNQSLIRSRLAEGYEVDQFITVINTKTAQWINDPKMSEYLRPETLFGAKFEGYLNTKSEETNDGKYSEYATCF